VNASRLDGRAPPAKPPASVLVIVTRRLGDVLLATPLVRSVKAAWPQAGIDVLAFAGTEGVLEANPDVRRVITIAERPGLLAHIGFAFSLLRRYDVALSCHTGDRPTLYALLAGRWRAGFVGDGSGARWKRWSLSRPVRFDDLDTHTVAMNLALADALGVARCHEIGIGRTTQIAARAKAALGGGRVGDYAVLHPYPKFNYKMWRVDGWVGLAHWLAERGLAVVLTGGGGADETGFVASVAARMPGGTLDLAGRLSFAQTACVIGGARLYVGPDTATTHMAAALGVPTVALYGPSNPVKWGPWPQRSAAARSPWRRTGTQTAGNVCLVQGVGACVPCMEEGCDRHAASFSECLQQLPLAAVVAAAERALAGGAA
jgi:heptosyltransferase-3